MADAKVARASTARTITFITDVQRAHNCSQRSDNQCRTFSAGRMTGVSQRRVSNMAVLNLAHCGCSWLLVLVLLSSQLATLVLCSTCPPAAPEPRSSCPSTDETCEYDEFCCCKGTPKESCFFTTTAYCIEGKWEITQASVQCPSSETCQSGGLLRCPDVPASNTPCTHPSTAVCQYNTTCCCVGTQREFCEPLLTMMCVNGEWVVRSNLRRECPSDCD